MPSENLLYYKLALYPEQAAEVEKVISSTKVKSAKLFRAAVMIVLNDDDLLQEAVAQCNQISYRKTGANSGQWKAHIRKEELKRAKEKLKAQSLEEDDGEY